MESSIQFYPYQFKQLGVEQKEGKVNVKSYAHFAFQGLYAVGLYPQGEGFLIVVKKWRVSEGKKLWQKVHEELFETRHNPSKSIAIYKEGYIAAIARLNEVLLKIT